MSDIYETIDRYGATCKEVGTDVNPHVKKVLEQEKDDAILDEKKGERHESMHLYLAGNNKLVPSCRLGDDDCTVMYKWLRNNLYVVSIDLRYNNIGDSGAEQLATLIQETASLRYLNLMCNDIGGKGAQHIAKALHTNETLVILLMNGNKMGNEGGMHFAQALQINETLESLDLGDTDQKAESVIAMSTVLNHNRTLKSLNMNRPLLFSHQEETTVHFAKMLKVNKGLQQLHLKKYDMRDFGVTWLAQNLTDNFYLTYLDLSCNRITRDGAKQLANLLKKDTPLKVLDLGYNRLGDDGAIILANALETYNLNLTSLVLVSNEISGKGLCAVADSLGMNTTLQQVYIWGNKLEESACIAFSNLLSTGRLETKNTDVEPYVVDGKTILSELSNGPERWYYWGPSYGDQAQKDLSKFVPVKA